MLDAKKFMAIYVFFIRAENYLGFFSEFFVFFLDSVLRGMLFDCSISPTGVFLGFHSFSRVLNVLWVFSLLFTGLKIDRYMDGWTDG